MTIPSCRQPFIWDHGAIGCLSLKPPNCGALFGISGAGCLNLKPPSCGELFGIPGTRCLSLKPPNIVASDFEL